MARQVPASSLFPYTTLFRSNLRGQLHGTAFKLDQIQRVRQHVSRMASAELFVGGPVTALDKTLDHLIAVRDRKSTRLNSSHSSISYAVFCLKKKKPALAHVLNILILDHTIKHNSLHSRDHKTAHQTCVTSELLSPFIQLYSILLDFTYLRSI